MTDKTLPAKLNEFTGSQLFDNKVGQLPAVLQAIREEVISIVPDTSSKKGRDAIASNAYRVARSKTYIDDEGKAKTAALRAETKRIDDMRRESREFLDSLKTEVRGPLDDWQAEQERIKQRQQELLDRIERIQWPEDVEQIRADLAELQAVEIREEDFGPLTDRAKRSLGFAIDAGRQALEGAEEILEKQREAERLREELATLQRQAAELEQANRELEEQKRRAEAAEKRKQNKAEEAKRKRAEAKERKEREERIAREAAEKATREAEERAEEARQAAERERQREEDERIAREAAEAEIERQRAEDEKHVAMVDEVIVEAIEKAIDGLTGESPHANAIAILDALKFGLIPRVSIDY